jgi:hypothetical protein
MQATSRGSALAGLALGLIFMAGCGEKGEKLYQVSGTVTYDGKPIPKGLIFFDPDPSKGTGGMQGFANIQDGKYTTAVEGQGVRGGAYEVRVNGFDGKEANDAPFGQALFPEYRSTAELPKADSTYDLDVSNSRE